MKRFITSFLVLILIIAFAPCTQATETPTVIHYEEYTLDNGLIVRDEVSVYTQGRSSDITAQNKKTIYDGDTIVAIIVLRATFLYDGSTVSVVSKSVTQSDTYDGWDYVQNSLTSSGGTVTLNAKITKWFIFNTPFTMTLSCDKDGNISYT